MVNPPASVSSRTATWNSAATSSSATSSWPLRTIVGTGRRPSRESSVSGVAGAVPCACGSDASRNRTMARAMAAVPRTTPSSHGYWSRSSSPGGIASRSRSSAPANMSSLAPTASSSRAGAALSGTVRVALRRVPALRAAVLRVLVARPPVRRRAAPCVCRTYVQPSCAHRPCVRFSARPSCDRSCARPSARPPSVRRVFLLHVLPCRVSLLARATARSRRDGSKFIARCMIAPDESVGAKAARRRSSAATRNEDSASASDRPCARRRSDVARAIAPRRARAGGASRRKAAQPAAAETRARCRWSSAQRPV